MTALSRLSRSRQQHYSICPIKTHGGTIEFQICKKKVKLKMIVTLQVSNLLQCSVACTLTGIQVCATWDSTILVGFGWHLIIIFHNKYITTILNVNF